jgi:hypothetical protein
MHASNALPTKDCAVCGRAITWRKKWERDWENVKHCSDACRRRARSPDASRIDDALQRAILELLRSRSRDASICPSEAARAVRPDDWRSLMEPARAAARRLASDGTVEITQKGRVVDPSFARGPIRIRMRR